MKLTGKNKVIKMGKGILWTAITKLGTVGIFAGGLLMGMQYKSEVNKTKNEVLGREYAEHSTKSPVELIDEENSRGFMEKHLKNPSTGEVLYTLSPDYLPDSNEFIHKALCERIKEDSSRKELQQLYTNTRELEKKIIEELYSSKPVSRESANPLKIQVVARENDDGEIEAVLKYKENSVVLSRKEVDDITKYGKHIADPEKEEKGGKGYLYLGLTAILTAAGAGYRKLRQL